MSDPIKIIIIYFCTRAIYLLLYLSVNPPRISECVGWISLHCKPGLPHIHKYKLQQKWWIFSMWSILAFQSQHPKKKRTDVYAAGRIVWCLFCGHKFCSFVSEICVVGLTRSWWTMILRSSEEYARWQINLTFGNGGNKWKKTPLKIK